MMGARRKLAATATDSESLVREAWATELDPKVIEPLYTSVAKKNADVALMLARLNARSQESTRALVEESATLASPLLAAYLRTDRAAWAAGLLGHCRDRAATGALIALVEKTKDAQRRASGLHALAMMADDDGVAFAAKQVGTETPAYVIAELARRGVPSMIGKAIDLVRRWLDVRSSGARQRSDDAKPALATIEALGDARAKEALPVLHEALSTPYSPAVLAALALIADESSREHAQRLLGLLGGDRERNWPYRLGAESVLRALGDTLPLDEARLAFEWSHPRRYGWPKTEDHALLIAVAASAMLSGTKDDREKVARLACAPVRALRRVGAIAHEELHGRAPELRYFDPQLAKGFVKDESPKTVLATISSGTAVFRHNLVALLASTKDKPTRAKLADTCVQELESRLNHAVNYYEESDLGPDANGFIDAAEMLAKTPELKKRFAASTSLWIQHHLFKNDPVAWPSLPDPVSTLTATSRRLGSRADGAFAIGRHTNSIAISNDGSRLAVVGSELGVILDASSGATLVELVLKYNWRYDAVFSRDDSQLIVAYHGGHVEVFDATTGKRARELEGHGGVPDGVRGLALSPDGKRLLSVGSDNRAILWSLASGKALKKWSDEKGAFQACAFSADGGRFVATHLKSSGGANYLLVGKGPNDTKKVATPSSMWAAVFMKDGTLITAGDGAHILFWNERFKAVRKLSQKKVVRLVLSEDERSLFALSETGELNRWNLVSGKATKLDLGDGQAWALARDPKTGMVFAAGTAGVLHRFDREDQKLQSAPLVIHTGQVRGFACLPDGRFWTAGWDGKLIAWRADGSPDRLLHTCDGRMSELALSTDREHVYVVANEVVKCFETRSGELVSERKEDAESIAISQDGALLAIGYSGGLIRTFNAPALTPRDEISTGKAEVSAIAACEDGWVAGADDGRVFGLGRHLEVRWTSSEHGRDLVEGEPMGNPHKTVMWVDACASGVLSAATDHTVRLWTANQRQVKRWLCDSGLFNNATFSPRGDRVACASSWTVEVFDVRTGDKLAHLGKATFPGVDELTRVAWRDDTELLVGAENGNVYCVSLGG